jgi:predicted MFS family arabinose efflux permease
MDQQFAVFVAGMRAVANAQSRDGAVSLSRFPSPCTIRKLPPAVEPMYSRRLKLGYFVVEGLNSFTTTFYFYYIYFFMQQAYGFGNRANLVLAALNGFCYTFGSWAGGRFSQRIGYLSALRIGFITMIIALLAGYFLDGVPAQVGVLCLITLGTCLTWPSLEALVSEGEDRAGVPHMVGLYNVVWSGTGAVSYFVGGAMLQHLGLKSIFLVPAVVLVVQLALTIWLQREAQRELTTAAARGEDRPVLPLGAGHPRAQKFLRLAWLANPCAYVGINTLVAVIPGVASKLELSTTIAGFCGSTWCFARFASFAFLWQWTAWHYRFRWLVAAFAAMIASFAAILVVPSLPVLVIGQLVFGGAVGLIYYSSLFYAMDVGETKGEHGGLHEAAIGLGNFVGPAVGAASLYLSPHPNSGALAVSGLLVLGLAGLAGVWKWAK